MKESIGKAKMHHATFLKVGVWILVKMERGENWHYDVGRRDQKQGSRKFSMICQIFLY